MTQEAPKKTPLEKVGHIAKEAVKSRVKMEMELSIPAVVIKGIMYVGEKAYDAYQANKKKK